MSVGAASAIVAAVCAAAVFAPFFGDFKNGCLAEHRSLSFVRGVGVNGWTMMMMMLDSSRGRDPVDSLLRLSIHLSVCYTVVREHRA